MDVVHRSAIASSGSFAAGKAQVSTYRLVGPQYFNFFVWLMAGVGVLFIFVAMFYREQDHVRRDETAEAG